MQLNVIIVQYAAEDLRSDGVSVWESQTYQGHIAAPLKPLQGIKTQNNTRTTHWNNKPKSWPGGEHPGQH